MIRVYSSSHTWSDIRTSQEDNSNGADILLGRLRQDCEHRCLQSKRKASLGNVTSKLKVKIKKKKACAMAPQGSGLSPLHQIKTK